jgi:hypothetical protein
MKRSARVMNTVYVGGKYFESLSDDVERPKKEREALEKLQLLPSKFTINNKDYPCYFMSDDLRSDPAILSKAPLDICLVSKDGSILLLKTEHWFYYGRDDEIKPNAMRTFGGNHYWHNNWTFVKFSVAANLPYSTLDTLHGRNGLLYVGNVIHMFGGDTSMTTVLLGSSKLSYSMDLPRVGLDRKRRTTWLKSFLLSMVIREHEIPFHDLFRDYVRLFI